MENDIRIADVWFDRGRIFMRDNGGMVRSRPLEAFPLLMEADEGQRLDYRIDPLGDAVRWPEIDEDIHVSSFLEQQEPDYDNEVARMLGQRPRQDVTEVARRVGINKSLLSKYISGIKTPSRRRLAEIEQAMPTL